jgi:peroxiredoxin
MNSVDPILKAAPVLLLMLLIMNACGQKTLGGVEMGKLASNFKLKTAEGVVYRLKDLREQVVILSFLNTQADGSGINGDMSRSQVVFLRSMAEQYGPKGVRILIVDATSLVLGQPASQDALINYSYDWHLEGIPVLMDRKKSSTARTYGVTQVPTTFLIDGEGIIQQRWDSFAPAQDLAFALQELVGEPVYRELTE